jgi:hypothetical protein
MHKHWFVWNVICVARDTPVHWLHVTVEALPATVTAVHGLDYQTRTLRELIASWAIEHQKTWNSCVLYSRDFISSGGKVAIFEVFRALCVKIEVFYCITTCQLVGRAVLKESTTSIFRFHVAREPLLGLLMHPCSQRASSWTTYALSTRRHFPDDLNFARLSHPPVWCTLCILCQWDVTYHWFPSGADCVMWEIYLCDVWTYEYWGDCLQGEFSFMFTS